MFRDYLQTRPNSIKPCLKKSKSIVNIENECASYSLSCLILWIWINKFWNTRFVPITITWYEGKQMNLLIVDSLGVGLAKFDKIEKSNLDCVKKRMKVA